MGLIQESLTGMERTMGAIRADVADLSASHQLLSERVSALQARAELAHSDPHVMREDSLALSSRLSDLTSCLSHIESSRPSPNVTISGIPASVTDSPRTMVLKVFEALGIPELAVDVLEIRSLIRGNGSTIGDPQRRSTAAGSTLSFIVTLKSPGIRDHIISKKRAEGNLTISQVFALDQPGSVFVRDFLPSAVYGLLRRTKAAAARRGYKYVWVRAGKICVRKSDGVVSSSSDLILTWRDSSDLSLFGVFLLVVPTLFCRSVLHLCLASLSCVLSSRLLLSRVLSMVLI